MWCYRYRYYDALGKRREKAKQGFVSEKDAYRALLEVKANVLNGEVKQVQHSNLTVSEWLDIWFETHKNDWKVTTQSQRENAIKYQMKPLLGKYKLLELDKTTYKRVYINKLLKDYKPSTVRLFHRLFKIAINAAVDDEILTRNRFNKIIIVQEEVGENFYTPKELKKFLSCSEQQENITCYTAAYTLAYTGFRKGELQGLKWSDFKPENHTLKVSRTRDNKGVRTPKTKRSYRQIEIDPNVTKQLLIYKKWCKELLLSFGKKLSEDDFIFISYQTGAPITDNLLKYSMERVAIRNNLKQITPHGLRHTHATILISQKQPVTAIAERLGNTPQMIWDVYAHNFKALEEETVLAFSQAINI